MSNLGLFVIGAVCTLIVAAAPALLFYAIILDRRHAAEMRPGGEQALEPEIQRRVSEADRRQIVAA